MIYLKKKRPNFSENCFPILEHGEMMLMFTSHDCYKGKEKRSLQSEPTLQWELSNIRKLQLTCSTANIIVGIILFPTLFSHLRAWSTPVWMQRQGTWNQILPSYKLDNLYQVTPHIWTRFPICKSWRTMPSYWEDDGLPEDAWKWWMHGQESVNHSWMETSVWVI